MCIKFKTLRVVFKIYSPYILRFLCFVSFILIIVIFSKYSNDASSMRSWMTEKNNYVSPSPNKTIYQIISDWYLKDNNVSVIKINSTGFDIDKDKDEEVSENEFLSAIEQQTDNNNDEDNFNADKPTLYETTHKYSTVATKVTTEKTECKPEPPRSDFSECGNRIADRKCCEYIWAWKYKKELLERKKCRSKGRHMVIGGEKVQPGEYPHMAAIGFQLKSNITVIDFKCGGSLISEQYVLTAGHCTKLAQPTDYEPEPIMVRLGVENIKMIKNNEGVDVGIENITRHPDYKPPQQYFDIALLKLYKRVTFTYAVHPACLSTDLFTKIKTANVTGWGSTQYVSDRGSDHLLVATLKIVEHETCHRLFEYMDIYNRKFKILRQSQICAGSDVKKVDTCQGDSGGPLQVRINTTFGNIHRVYGVTSAGTMCGIIGIPATYVKVAAAITWIENIVWPEYNNHTNYKTTT